MPRPQVALQAVHDYYGEQLGIMDALNAVKALSCPLQIHQKGGVNLCQNAIGYERTARILQLLDDLHFHKYIASLSSEHNSTDAILRDTVLIVQFMFCGKHNAEHYPGDFKNRFEIVFNRARQCPIFRVEEVAGHWGGKWGDDRVRKLVDIVEENGTGIMVKGKGKRRLLEMEVENGKRWRSQRQSPSRGGGSDSDGGRDSVLSPVVSTQPYWLSSDGSFGGEHQPSTTTDSGPNGSVQSQGAHFFPPQQESLVQYQPQQFPTQQQSLAQHQPHGAEFFPTQKESLYQSQPQQSMSMENFEPASYNPYHPHSPNTVVYDNNSANDSASSSSSQLSSAAAQEASYNYHHQHPPTDPLISDLSGAIVYNYHSANNASSQPCSTVAQDASYQSAPFETSAEPASAMDPNLQFYLPNTAVYGENSANNSSSQLPSTAAQEASYGSSPFVDPNLQFDPNLSFNYNFPIDLVFPEDSNLPDDSQPTNNSNYPNDSNFPDNSNFQSNAGFRMGVPTMASNRLLGGGEQSTPV